MKRWIRAGVAGLLAVAIAGHVYFWYWPRERPARPRAGTATAELLFEGDQDLRLWLPFPHQNLASAGRAVARARSVGGVADPATLGGADLATVAGRLAGVGDVDLPSFGPFDMPPSRSVAVAVNDDGEELAVVVEMYPVLALLSRLAGVVADNPLLAGGPVVLGERRYETSWSGRSWTLSASTGRRRGASRIAAAERRVLGLVVLGRDRDPFPAGVYAVEREGSTLVARTEGDDGGGRGTLPVLERELAFVGLRSGAGSTSLLLMPAPRQETTVSLPVAAILVRGGEARWSLPGHRIARLLDMEPVRETAGGWDIVASEASALDLARSVAAEMDRTRPPLPRFAVALRPGLYQPLAATIASITERVPLVPRDEARYWSEISSILAAVPAASRLAARVEADGWAEVRVSLIDTVQGAP